MATTDRNIRLLEDSEADIPTATNDAIEDINRELHEVEAVAEAGPDWNEIQNIPTEFPPSEHTHAKSEVGLANVDNTADLNKPISTATQTALDGKADLVSGMLKASQIPLEILGALRYQTGWNAATNTPNIAAGDVFKGYYWIVTTPGTTSLGGITDWQVGDHAVYDGTGWTKYDYSQVVYTAANVAATDPTGNGATVLQTVLNNLFDAITARLSKASNLSDLASIPQALINLGLQRQIYTVTGNLAIADVSQTVLFSAHPWARQVEIHLLGGGCGGGAGGTAATGVAVNGGNSGSGAALTIARFWIDDLIAAGADRLVIIAGRGGPGEAGKTANNQAASSQGGTGGNPSRVEIRNVSTLIEIIAHATGGSNAASSAGSWFGGGRIVGSSGQYAGQNGTNDVQLNQAGAPGSPGSGITAPDTSFAGRGGSQGMYVYRRNSGFPAYGAAPQNDVLGYRAGSSGYGGASSVTGNADSGGNGGPGCGGGGGGAARNGFTSGAGGDGGPGIARVIFFF